MPTVPDRERLLSRLLHGLSEQWCDGLEVIVLPGEGGMGDKVNRGFQAASGEWVAVIDDDDELAADFADCVLEACEFDPDMVGYRIASMRNGALMGMIEHRVDGDRTWSTGRRGPCPKMPVRTSIARCFEFGNEYTADRVWSAAVAGVLESGVFVDRTLYRHDYWTAGVVRPDVGVWPFDQSLFRWL